MPDPLRPSHTTPARLRRRLWLAVATTLALALAMVVLFRPDRRTAWDQAALSRGTVQDDPVTLSLWANELGVLLRRSEALGAMPEQRQPLLRWMAAQCSITLQIQALQRHYRRPVESAAEMGRLPYCEDLEMLKRRGNG
ncbi:MAG: hypothetical protein ACK5FE_12500 [Cyanobacteriota bacterium]